MKSGHCNFSEIMETIILLPICAERYLITGRDEVCCGHVHVYALVATLQVYCTL